MPPNAKKPPIRVIAGGIREGKGVGQMKICPALIGIKPAVSIAPIKEGFPRTIQHGLDPRQCRNRRKILPGFDTLPIPSTEPRSFRRLLLRDACPDPHGRNISPETRAQGTGHRLFRWHGRYRCPKEIHATRGFTSLFENDTSSFPLPKLMNAGTPIACSWISLNGQLPRTIPRAEHKNNAANYAMIPHITGSRRSQARTWITQK